ncbi:hypothetical protein D3C78_1208120 [compost metagenome]
MPPRIHQPTFALPVIGISQVVVNRGIDGRHEQDAILALPLRQQILRVGKNHVRACKLRITAKQTRLVQKVAHHRLCIGRIAPDHFRVHHDRPAPRLCVLLLQVPGQQRRMPQRIGLSGKHIGILTAAIEQMAEHVHHSNACRIAAIVWREYVVGTRRRNKQRWKGLIGHRLLKP